MSNQVRNIIIGVMVVAITSLIIGVSYSVMSELGFNTDNKIDFNSTLKVTFQNTNELDLSKENNSLFFSVVNYGTIDMEYKILLDISLDEKKDLDKLKIVLDEKEYAVKDLKVIDGKYLLKTGAINRENSPKDAISHKITASGVNKGLIKVEVQSNAINDLAVDVIRSLNYSNNKFGLATDYNDNVRYVGENSYNYISFNDELWRIIGVFEVKDNLRDVSGLRVKIVRDIPLGMREWSQGMDSFINSDLNKYLNGEYYKSLKNTNNIDYATYKIGKYSSIGDSIDALKLERIGEAETSMVTMPTVADYLYGKLWMSKGVWLVANSNNVGSYYKVNDEGNIGLEKYNERALVSPVVYLNSNVRIVDGDGSRTKPFVIQ